MLKKSNALALRAILVFLLSNSCQKSTSSLQGLSRLSGNWIGVINTVALNSSCTLDPATWTTKQVWTVDDNGNVTIFDSVIASPTDKRLQTWTGKIDSNYKMEIYTTWNRSGSCGTSLIMKFSDKINVTPNSASVKDTVDFPLCPPNNCIFKLQYSLIRQ